MYLSKLLNVFVQIVTYSFPNLEVHLSNSHFHPGTLVSSCCSCCCRIKTWMEKRKLLARLQFLRSRISSNSFKQFLRKLLLGSQMMFEKGAWSQKSSRQIGPKEGPQLEARPIDYWSKGLKLIFVRSK